MIVTKSEHKAYLFNLFYPVIDGTQRERSFSLDELIDASGALKKLKEVANGTETGQGIRYVWDDKPLEFSSSETKILHNLVSNIKEATPSEAEVITELRDLLK